MPLALQDRAPVVTVLAADPEQTQGVNSREQLAQLERRYQRDIARQLMDSGVTLADPARLDVRGELTCAEDVFIDVGCVFEGRVQLGANVRIGAHCVLRDCEVGAGTVIAPLSHLTGARIGADCSVGPFARLRPGPCSATARTSATSSRSRTPYWAKRRRPTISATWATPASASGVNIGAGTITCNYDGANKYRTVIEDGAFIGSDTQLVAPVTVGRVRPSAPAAPSPRMRRPAS